MRKVLTVAILAFTGCVTPYAGLKPVFAQDTEPTTEQVFVCHISEKDPSYFACVDWYVFMDRLNAASSPTSNGAPDDIGVLQMAQPAPEKP